jgi:hypothetical protein
MQLRVARLCLDCEEIHDDQRCPVCASETFAFISRWVPVPERRSQQRAEVPARRLPSKKSMVGYGVLGLSLAGLARWAWQARHRFEEAAQRGAGDLQ